MSAEARQLSRTVEVIEDIRRRGLHLGAQAFATVRGEAVADLALGECRPGVPMRTDSLLLWLSSSKPVAAVAVMQIVEQGRLALGDKVSEHLPAFAAGGKGEITLEQLLTHTGGFRLVNLREPKLSWEETIAKICEMKLDRDWMPGQKAGYHVGSSWYILAELVRLLDGRGFSQYVREAIFLPLGMTNCWIGMPIEQQLAYGDRLGQAFRTDVSPPVLHHWSTPEGIAHTGPGGNGYGPAGELVRLYEMLLGGGQRDGVRLLQPETAAAITARRRRGMYDETFRHTMDWGLGVIINSAEYGVGTVPYGYGAHASKETFGHGGSQSSVAFADPAYGLAAAILFNGLPGEAAHQSRIRATIEALYTDLALRPYAAADL